MKNFPELNNYSNGKGESATMGFLSDYMPKPEPKEPTTEDIIDFYCRFGNKKMTAERFCITVKKLNAILKGTKMKTDKNDKYTEFGMSRRDFY